MLLFLFGFGESARGGCCWASVRIAMLASFRLHGGMTHHRRAHGRVGGACVIRNLASLCNPLLLQAAEVERLNGVYSKILQSAGVEMIGALSCHIFHEFVLFIAWLGQVCRARGCRDDWCALRLAL